MWLHLNLSNYDLLYPIYLILSIIKTPVSDSKCGLVLRKNRIVVDLLMILVSSLPFLSEIFVVEAC